MPTIDYLRFPIDIRLARYSCRGFQKTRSKGIVIMLGYFVIKVLLLYQQFHEINHFSTILGFLSKLLIQKSKNILSFFYDESKHYLF